LCFFLLLSLFIGAVQHDFHATLALSAIAVLSKYGGIHAQHYLLLSTPSLSKIIHTS